MKYSICIVAYKDYTSLEKCIQSIRSSGIRDYEILVFNNSPAERHEFNSNVDSVLLTTANIGFSAGCNELAKIAKGEILIFLNPDTQVFGNWADDMAAGIELDTVAIGPVSNFVAGHQQVQRYGGEDRGFVETKLLIGFCLMIRKDIFNDLGGMDEKLFLGCDDLDLSWRIQRAGYKMAIATGVFVHHEGHTSMRLNPEKDRLIKESSDAFRAKLRDFYGDNPPSSEDLWGCKILAPVLKPMRLSVCMIVRGETEQWRSLIKSLMFADQIVVCDTEPNNSKGVISDWIGIGGYFGQYPKVDFLGVRRPWTDDFAAARNFALSKCTGDYVLWLDADDRVSPEAAALIDALIHKPGNNTALQTCHFAFKVENTGPDGEVKDSFYQSRLFPRLPGLEWTGIGGCKGYVHESYFENAQRLGLEMVTTNITIQHTGYADAETVRKKQERNLRLLAREPDNCFKWFNIGTSCLAMDNPHKAIWALEKALDCSEGESPIFIDNCRYTLALALSRNGQLYETIPLLKGNKKADSLYLLGEMEIQTGEIERGCDSLWAYLKMGEITDYLGSNYPIFRKQAVKTLTEIGVLAV